MWGVIICDGIHFWSSSHYGCWNGGHGMVQQQQMRCHGCKLMSLGSDLVGYFKTLDMIQPIMWLGLAEMDQWKIPPIKRSHILIGHIWRTWNGPAATDEEVSWQVIATNGMSLSSDLVGCFKTSVRIHPKNWLGLAQMGQQELVLQQNITHWSHMEDMEWSSSNRWDVMTINWMSFGSDLVGC